MNLHELNRGPKDNRYCGPAAFSFLTGVNTSDASLVFRQHFGLYRIRGLATRHLIGALREAGLDAYRRTDYEDNLTLAQWLKVSKGERKSGRVWLIVAGNHFQIVSGRKDACGRIGKMVGLSDKRIKKRCRVEIVFEVIPRSNHRQLLSKLKRDIESWKANRRVDSDQSQAARRRAKKIANEWGIEIEVDDFGGGCKSIYFFAPGWLEELRNKGVLDFTTVAYDWFEAADVAQELEETIRECQKKGLDLMDRAA